MCLFLFYFILFFFIPWKPVCFLMADRKGVNSDGKGGKKELERVQGGRMVIRIEYMKKNPLSNKRKKKQVSKLTVVVYMCCGLHVQC